jgi:hypothetical protein
MSLRLEPLSTGQVANWDSLVAEFPHRQVFHRQAWFNCLAEVLNADWRYWAVTDHGRTVGYFSGGIIQRGPFRILGSPLRTWHTTNMGPLLQSGVDGRSFVQALDDLAREERLSMIEIEYLSMPHAAFEEAEFSCHQTWTHQLALSTDLHAMMKPMSKGRKHGIHKAQRSGLEVVECEDVAFRLHDQLSRTLQRKGAVCPFPISFPEAIIRHLKPLGLVFALGVRNPAGDIIAAGLFPSDNGVVYLWDSSSELEGREFHPNDLLHWELMCRAAGQGISLYDMSGYGRFNKAFGAQLVATHRWNKCYCATARLARELYEQVLKIERHSTAFGRLLSPLLR